jgi:glutamate synthase (ferredoxin)
MWHKQAYGSEETLKRLVNYGFVKYYQKKEYHDNTPPMSRLLHSAIGLGKPFGDSAKDITPEGFDMYKAFQESLETSPPTTIRNMLEIKSDREPIPIDQVCNSYAIVCDGAWAPPRTTHARPTHGPHFV